MQYIDIARKDSIRQLGVQMNARVADAVVDSSWHLFRSMPVPDLEAGEDVALLQHSPSNHHPFSASVTWDQVRTRRVNIASSKLVWFPQGCLYSLSSHGWQLSTYFIRELVLEITDIFNLVCFVASQRRQGTTYSLLALIHSRFGSTLLVIC